MNKIGVFASGGDSPGKYLVRNSKNISKQIMYKNIVHHYCMIITIKNYCIRIEMKINKFIWDFTQ